MEIGKKRPLVEVSAYENYSHNVTLQIHVRLLFMFLFVIYLFEQVEVLAAILWRYIHDKIQ